MAAAAAKKTNGKPDPKHNIEAVREAYYQRIAKHDMKPLWKVMNNRSSPRSPRHAARRSFGTSTISSRW